MRVDIIAAPQWCSREINHDFYVAVLVNQSVRPLLDRNPARDQAIEPTLIGALQRHDGIQVMLAVGVDRAEYRIVVEDHGAVEPSDINLQIATGRRYAEQTDDARSGGAAKRVAHDGRCAGAFHQNVRLDHSHISKLADVKAGAEFADDLPLGSPVIVVEHVYLKAM